MAFAGFRDAKQVLEGKRFVRYELELLSEKTRFVEFRVDRPGGKNHPSRMVCRSPFLASATYGESHAEATPWCGK